MARKYSKKSDLSNLGPLEYPAGMPDDEDIGDNGLPEEGVAFLDTISNSESAGVYNVVYRGDKFNNYDDHPKVWVQIPSGPNKGKYSSAAGKYQFIAPTWNAAKEALGLTDFSPASQDKAAWWLAQRDYRDRTGGRDLLKDLQAGGNTNMKRIGRTLSQTWTSLPGGIEQGQNGTTFADSYNALLGQRRGGTPVPPVGIADDGKVRVAGKEFDALPSPAPLAFGKQPAKAPQTTLSPNTRRVVESVIGLGAPSAQATATGGSAPRADVKTSVDLRKPAVTGLGLTMQQIGQQGENDRMSGIREIREMGPSSKGAPMKAAPAPVKGSGVVRTENQQAQLVPMPRDVRPSSVGPAPEEPVIPKYIVTTTKVPLGQSPQSIEKLQDIHDRRDAAQMGAQTKKSLPAPAPLKFKTITEQKLNPEWVEQQKKPAPTAIKPVQPMGIAPRRAGGIGIGMTPVLGSIGIGRSLATSPAGRAAATPGVSHNYSTVSHAGERTDVHGNDMAFQPRSVQTSDRHNTGY